MKNIRSLFFLTLGLALLASCKPKKSKYNKVSGLTMGTSYAITVKGSVDKEQVDSLLKDFSSIFSTYEESFITRFNKTRDTNKWFSLGPRHQYYFQLFEKLKRLNDLTDNAFNPCAAPLFDAWGFTEKTNASFDETSLDSLLSISSFNAIKVEGNKLKKTNKYAKLNLNAVAKGFGVDVVAHFLEGKGIRHYLVEIGGELVSKGKSPQKKDWNIGVRNPMKEEDGQGAIDELPLINKAMATSGNYENFKMHGDKVIGHTIDPRTGYPAESLMLSSTVFAADCLTADALATACMVLGEKKSIALIESLEEVEGYFIIRAEEGEGIKVYRSPGLQRVLNN